MSVGHEHCFQQIQELQRETLRRALALKKIADFSCQCKTKCPCNEIQIGIAEDGLSEDAHVDDTPEAA